MSDAIVKVVDLKAPVSRVWQALTDHKQFGTWFRVALDQPFAPGELSTGKMTYPGYEGHPWRAKVVHMQAERLFAFQWMHSESSSGTPRDIGQTLVEFRLDPTPSGTRLTITESGFDGLPDPHRLEMLRDNTEGWNIQSGNIKAYVEA